MAIDLMKQKAGIVLAKKQLNTIKARIGFAVDVSGSMEDEFRDGIVQNVADRFMGLALNLDDNGEMDMWTFDNRMTVLPTANSANIGNYVRREIMENSSVSKWAGTEYAGPIKAAQDKWFPAAKAATKSGGLFGLFSKSNNDGISETESASLARQPAVLLFLTDGDNMDERDAERALVEAQGKPFYVQFIGIGTASFRFIKRVGDAYPNVGFLSVRDIRSMSDEALYEGLVTDELAAWLKKTATA